MIRPQHVHLTPVSCKFTKRSILYTALRALGIFAIWLMVSSAQAQFYKWVDDAGRIHYSETPPPSREFQMIAPRTSARKTDRLVTAEKLPAQNLDQKDQKHNKSDEKVQTAANNEQTRKKNCDIATHNLNTLHSRGRLRIFDGKKYRILSPEQREARISQAKIQIEQYCD
jgi:hypothetical protein